MPCILKQRTDNSPGILSFTANEALWGVCSKSKRLQRFLSASRTEGTWLAGVHVQGDLSWMDRWPLEDWHSFVMWPEASDPFVATLPEHVFLPLNCINFLPDDAPVPPAPRSWDLCVVTRPATIKRANETLATLRALLDIDGNVTANVIAPDPRSFGRPKSVKEQDLVPEFYRARDLFTARELPNISFLASSVESFGRFPLGSKLLDTIVGGSRFLFLYSHSEGTPRALAEALLLGTPCIVSKSLRTGIRKHLTTGNTLFVADDPAVAAREIHAALRDYDRFSVDVTAARRVFGATANLPELVERLGRMVAASGRPIGGDWYLRDLHVRLACHGEKYNSQLMGKDDGLFFKWLEAVETLDPYDEDAVLGPLLG